MKYLFKNQKGDAIVEAALQLPLCVIVVFTLYYFAIFVCQKANLQANLQNALIYYKNPVSDTYVMVNSDTKFKTTEGGVESNGSSFPSAGAFAYKNPYRFLTSNSHFKSGNFQSQFTSYFLDMCGYMFFDNGDNISVNVTTKNYVVYKEIEATATQTVFAPINLFGIKSTEGFSFVVTDKVVITNSDDFIRDVDFAVDIIKHTKFGEKLGEIVDKAAEYYKKFNDFFHGSAE